MTHHRCTFCKRTMPPVERACNDGWIPSYYDCLTDREMGNPVCPDCVKSALRFNPDMGDYERRINALDRMSMAAY